MATLVTIVTGEEREQVKRFANDAVDCAIAEGCLDKDSIQVLIGNGDEFLARIIAGIKELSVSNLFADEEVKSSYYAYPKDYEVKRIAEQVCILRQLFPGIGYADEKLAEEPLPLNAEGWFAIPRWQTIAPTYNQAVAKVLAMIKSERRFYNNYEDLLGAMSLRQHGKKAEMFRKLGDEQKNHDILVVPAQFGFRHRGRSVRRAREVFLANEFGLGVYEIGIMLLTHPEREARWEQLHIVCAGDEFTLSVSGGFVHAPSFFCRHSMIKFGVTWFGNAKGGYGSASAFLPAEASV